MTWPVLATARLRLRAWNDNDRAPFAALNADPQVREHFVGVLTREESDAFVDRIQTRFAARGYGLWAVERIDDGRFLGYTGLAHWDWPGVPFTPCVEIGWRLAREAWGQGYATEAGRAVLAFGFGSAALDEIVSFTTPANRRSWAVMERLGMVRDPHGDFDHPEVPVGHPVRPHVLYRLSRERWLALGGTLT
jgi:ribosomal-protein-alanine N-acetyltransferase